MSLQSQTILKYMGESDMPPAMIKGLAELVGKIDSVMSDFDREAARLKKSDQFTATGVEQRTSEAAQNADRRLSEIEHSADGYTGHIEQLQTLLKPADRTGDAVLLFLQESEVRERLAGLDELQLQIRYLAACREGGPGADLISAAVESDPLPRLSEDVINEGREARGLRTSPDEARKLSQIIRLRDGLRSALREARAALVDAGLPADDPIRVIAGLEPDKD